MKAAAASISYIHVYVCIHANTRSTICTTSTFKSAKVSFYTILHPPPLITNAHIPNVYISVYPSSGSKHIAISLALSFYLFPIFLFLLICDSGSSLGYILFYCIISLFLFYYFLSAFQSWSFN